MKWSKIIAARHSVLPIIFSSDLTGAQQKTRPSHTERARPPTMAKLPPNNLVVCRLEAKIQLFLYICSYKQKRIWQSHFIHQQLQNPSFLKNWNKSYEANNNNLDLADAIPYNTIFTYYKRESETLQWILVIEKWVITVTHTNPLKGNKPGCWTNEMVLEMVLRGPDGTDDIYICHNKVLLVWVFILKEEPFSKPNASPLKI